MLAPDNSSVRARQGARDMLVKALYQWQLGGHDLSQLEDQFMVTPENTRADLSYFKDLLSTVISGVDKFDKLIAMHAGREVATVDAIGRAILLLGFAEFESRCDVPVKVVINEAVELAKRYGSPDCYRFVNAVLDKAAKAMPPQRQCDTRG